MKENLISKVCLAAAAFLIPLIGGQISTDMPLPLAPGVGPVLQAIFGGPFLQGFEVPILSHLVIGLLIAVSLGASLIRRSVIQLPNLKLSAMIVGFFGLVFISVGLSAFRFASMTAAAEWLTYALAFFTACAVLGRRHGPMLVLTSLFVGVCVLAIYGIGIEYRIMRLTDPSHRIFAGWVNPNAAAGMMIIGLMIGIGLLASLERVPKLLASIGCVLIAWAIFLTGSKAGVGAAVVGIAAFALLGMVWPGRTKERVARAGTAVAVLALGFGMFFVNQKVNQPQGGPGVAAVGRLSTYNETQAQSLEFRKLLWKGSAQLSMQRLTGFGIGTYRFEGSRPGLTTQTQLAHNNILQLAMETSWLGALLLPLALAVWLFLAFRGSSGMKIEINMARAGIVAAIAATFAHGMFESNLYYFGIGISFFLLMGVGLCLGADGLAPEFTPRGARFGLTALALVPPALLLYFGWAEQQRAHIRFAMLEGNRPAALETTSNLVTLAPNDGEAWNTLHLIDPRRRGEAIERAAAATPSPRILRNLAKYHQSQRKLASAESEINTALVRDPNNLNTLALGMEIARDFQDNARAKVYAERMVAVERTDYFKIRALPQMVETSTADARMYLAENSQDWRVKIDLLKPALDIYIAYARSTVPEVKRFAEGGMDFIGETPEKAIENCRQGLRAIERLSQSYRAVGESDAAVEVEELRGVFEEAVASLGGTK